VTEGGGFTACDVTLSIFFTMHIKPEMKVMFNFLLWWMYSNRRCH